MTDLILASTSPRRQSFLAALGLAFTVDAAEVDETPRPGELPQALVLRLSQEKARAVARRHPGTVVLAADTDVALGSKILGKPVDDADAAHMLAALRGRVHQVYTAVARCGAPVEAPRQAPGQAPGERSAPVAQLCRSDVAMRNYTDSEILAYVATGDPLDKAGAYAIQHSTFAPVESWSGCFAGIMGLPLGLVALLLGEAGIPVPANVTAVCEQVSGPGNCCLRRLPPGC